MEQLQRISWMEEAMDRAEAAVEQLSKALEEYRAARAGLEELTVYYQSEQWRQDFEDDRAGKLPEELKRGVLSEDGVYDLLCDHRELMEELREILTD